MCINPNTLTFQAFLERNNPSFRDICSYLGAEDLGNLSLTCKLVHEKIKLHYQPSSKALDKLKIQTFVNSLADLPEKKLCQWLSSSCKNGDLLKFKAFIGSRRFSEISRDSLGYALLAAAKYGRSDMVQMLMDSPRFSEVSKGDLLISTKVAKDYNHLNIAQKLAESINLTAIANSELLEEMLIKVSTHGSLEIVQQFIESNEFSNISRDCLGKSLIEASKYGHLSIAQAFMDSHRFSEISKDYLENSLIEASKYGRLDIVQKFISSNRFSEISGNRLEDSIVEAAKYGHLKIVVAFMNSSRFSEIFFCFNKVMREIENLTKDPSEELRNLMAKPLEGPDSSYDMFSSEGIENSLKITKSFLIKASDLIKTDVSKYEHLDIIPLLSGI